MGVHHKWGYCCVCSSQRGSRNHQKKTKTHPSVWLNRNKSRFDILVLVGLVVVLAFMRWLRTTFDLCKQKGEDRTIKRGRGRNRTTEQTWTLKIKERSCDEEMWWCWIGQRVCVCVCECMRREWRIEMLCLLRRGRRCWSNIFWVTGERLSSKAAKTSI